MHTFKACTRIALFLILSFFASSAFAQATRTWVSGVGDDVNPCSRTAPCKTFAGAISKTAPGGVIDVLDPGGYGAVTITKSITLEAIGTVASPLTNGGNGINVSAASTDVVVLRGLSIEGLGTATDGVKVNSVGKLVIENTTIQNFANDGVNFAPTNAAQLVMRNVTVTRSGNAAVQINSSSAQNATLTDVRLINGKGGLTAQSGLVTIAGSTISGNAVYGVSGGGGTGSTTISIVDSTVSDTAGTGVKATSSVTTINLARTTIVNNNGGYSVGTGTINTAGNNSIVGNATNTGALTPIGQQ